ncbi:MULTISPECIES: flippase [Pectobacterium]|uniref:flippase n=1 Tax=Pectobacterium TaxID=122277 RepID=UPI001C69DDD7|nr:MULTISPECIES: flippase [Pectobacterium]UUE58928.1 flippase [Pectobacterium aroidearum]UUE71755.1 flippase [Pectobacterium aroidearum]UUE76156.1 flippase [Pectobacterium aroidearum]UUE80381.1 flippase [Pectobacterium aroidearum]UXK01628.1 flippase [Pectobacterium aroidearum]
MDKVLFKNIVSLASIQGANFIIPLLTLPYLVRVLEPHGYGVWGFAVAFIQYFCILTDYGFNLSVTQKVSIHREDKKKISEIFWVVLSCKIILFFVGFVILLLLIAFSQKFYDIRWVLISAYSTVIASVIFPMWLFQGKEKMGQVALASIIAKLSAIPLIFVFVNGHDDAWIAALISGFTMTLSGVISIYFVWKLQWITCIYPTVKSIVEEFRDGWHVFISTAAISLYTTSTTVVLGLLSGPVAVGYFIAADKIRQAVQGLISPVSQAFYPRINALIHKDKTAGLAMIRKLLLLLTSGAFIFSLFLYFFSHEIITIAYGDKYLESVSVLKWLAWMPFVIAFNNVFGVQTLLVMGKKKIFSIILIASGLINLIFIFLLIPYFNATGAAISIFITEIIVTLLMFVAIIKCKIPLFKRD